MVSNSVTNITEVPIAMASLPGLSIILTSVFTPTSKKKNVIPNVAIVSMTTVPLRGNNEDAMALSCPRREVPNTIPPW